MILLRVGSCDRVTMLRQTMVVATLGHGGGDIGLDNVNEVECGDG